MKSRILLSTLFAFLLITSNAQFGKIPVEATNAFKTKYPEATNVSWKSGLSNYRATFDLNNIHYTAEFNSTAQWVKTEGKLTYDKLPKEVSDSFHKGLYSKWERNEMVKIEQKDKEAEYRIKVKKPGGLTGKYLFFNATGQLLREAVTI
jgi:hypothetical protein